MIPRGYCSNRSSRRITGVVAQVVLKAAVPRTATGDPDGALRAPQDRVR